MFSAKGAGLNKLLFGLAAVGALVAAEAAHAQAVVVRSSGPSAAQYPQGKRLPADAKVTLRAGDQVTVLDRAGTRVLAGPKTFTLDSAVTRDRSSAAARAGGMLGGGAAPRVRTGAVRGAPAAGAVRSTPGATAGAATSSPSDVWDIDVTKGGTYCVADPASLVLWRPNRDQVATGKLTALSGGKAATVTWKRGNMRKAWPAELTVADGATYTFSDPVGPTVRIVTRVVGAPPADSLEVAGLLGDRGCMAQLELLANAAGPAASGG